VKLRAFVSSWFKKIFLTSEISMKKRVFIDKAEWSDERESDYKKMALEIAYRKGIELIERDGNVYKIENKIETLFANPINLREFGFKPG
jgi:hypothetical protein